MVYYLIQARIRDQALFADYLRGHLPTLAAFGGQLVFRSAHNLPVLGHEHWDAVALQAWPDQAHFEQWWHSADYRPWAEIRDQAAEIRITACLDASGPWPAFQLTVGADSSSQA